MSKIIQGHNPGLYQADNPSHVKIWSALEEKRTSAVNDPIFQKEERTLIAQFAGRCLRKAYEKYLKIDPSGKAFLVLDGKSVEMYIPGTDLKELFTYASDCMEGKHGDELGLTLDADTMGSVLQKFLGAISTFIYAGGHFEVDNENESEIKCLGKSLKARHGSSTNLNDFSRAVLERFENELRSLKD